MKREFKFEVGQYVKVAGTILEINKDLPKYPCKINYRFFDGKENSYIICDDNENERPFFERDLVLYANNSNNYDTILEMQKEILALQQRITNLEFEVSKANREYKAFSLPGSVKLEEAIEQLLAENPEGKQ
ncbi:hypothetical protein [Prevotella pallens]|jgi:hypothetical protein|uniref:hypothetical protein n=1 Tax=Prevotella pallens TaxID=60133 RepID=UPI001CB561DA|nr:hypothetical protein [Prevotella pallens]MBF1517426.1 hypothetical protein [Prevotella pallens]